MASVPVPAPEASKRSEKPSRFRVPEMWPSLAICAVWLVVLVDAVFGPDIVSTSAGTLTRIPSSVILAFFAWLATRVIAKHGFTPPGDESARGTE